MRYVKVLDLRKRNLLGFYNHEENLMVIDFSGGILQAIVISYHEFSHRILHSLQIEDWVDLFDPLFTMSILKKPRTWWRLFRIVFYMKPQRYYPLKDEQRVEE